MTLDGYIAFHHGHEGLYGVSNALVNREERRANVKVVTVQTEEERGARDLYKEPDTVACFAAIGINCLLDERVGDSIGEINRLSTILEKTARILKKKYDDGLHRESLIVLYRALSQYPRGFMDLKVRPDTTAYDILETIADKTEWVSQELKNVKRLGKKRQRDLMHFCIALSREARQGGVHIPKNLLAA